MSYRNGSIAAYANYIRSDLRSRMAGTTRLVLVERIRGDAVGGIRSQLTIHGGRAAQRSSVRLLRAVLRKAKPACVGAKGLLKSGCENVGKNAVCNRRSVGGSGIWIRPGAGG